MSGDVALVRCPEARIYDHGPGHPLRPDRVLLTWDLIAATGLDVHPGVEVLGCEPASDDVLGLVHTREYIEATKAAGIGEVGDWTRFGYGPGDNPIFDRMHEAGALVAGASVDAARAVWRGERLHAFNAAGGLHHAMPARASGFCVYDDPAVAIAWLLREGAERIAYVDVDVHQALRPFYLRGRASCAPISIINTPRLVLSRERAILSEEARAEVRRHVPCPTTPRRGCRGFRAGVPRASASIPMCS